MWVVGTDVELAQKRGDFAGEQGTAAGEAVTCKMLCGNLEIINNTTIGAR